MTTVVREFNNVLRGRLGVVLRGYQIHVAEELVAALGQGKDFIVVTMPTGSGKTLLEMLVAHALLKNQYRRVLVIEPTRFLCDQMYSRLWKRVFGGMAGKEYEGDCRDFLDQRKSIVISTPQTALKCASTLDNSKRFDVVVLDEAHHAFGGRYYAHLLAEARPAIVVGFTALLPSYRRYRLDPLVRGLLGEPLLLAYDFKRLASLDSSFEPPKAVADLFDAEMNSVEARVYEDLFTGRIVGDSRTIKYLEAVLARYGSKAFCESYSSAVGRGKVAKSSIVEGLCRYAGFSHKARILAEILRAYGVPGESSLKPILVYTSRRATAQEFKEVVVKELGLNDDRVGVLTGDMDKRQRLELVKRAREGSVDIIVSTLVGEEGIDIPEAGLLVMTDVPRPPLRFYQRIGRLVRLSSPMRLKYLVVALTPRTREYVDLEEALLNLYGEGVDVNYIIINVDVKGPTAKVVEVLEKASAIYSDIAIPYTMITRGRELSNPLSYIVGMIKSREELMEAVRSATRYWGIWQSLDSEDALAGIVFDLMTFHFLRNDRVKRVFDELGRLVERGSFARVLSDAVKAGKVFYIYDVDKMAQLLSEKMKNVYRECTLGGRRISCEDLTFRLDKKWVLRLYSRLFILGNIDAVKSRLQSYVEDSTRRLGDWAYVNVTMGKYNSRAKMLAPRLGINANLGSARLRILAQINYYDVSEKLSTNSNVLELIKLNLLAIGYRALEHLLDELHSGLGEA